jgi:hypothetical protein
VTSVLKVEVLETCQSTVTSALAMPPCPSALSGEGASRVHNTTLSGNGSPEATPRVKGYGVAARAPRSGRAAVAAAPSPPSTKMRRLKRVMATR